MELREENMGVLFIQSEGLSKTRGIGNDAEEKSPSTTLDCSAEYLVMLNRASMYIQLYVRCLLLLQC